MKEEMNSNEFEIVIDFCPIDIASKQWEKWKKEHDLSNLESDDILVDTGREEFEGKTCDIRRYRIRKEKMMDMSDKNKQQSWHLYSLYFPLFGIISPLLIVLAAASSASGDEVMGFGILIVGISLFLTPFIAGFGIYFGVKSLTKNPQNITISFIGIILNLICVFFFLFILSAVIENKMQQKARRHSKVTHNNMNVIADFKMDPCIGSKLFLTLKKE